MKPVPERGNSFLKRLDKCLGVPLVILLGFFRRRTSFPRAKKIHRIAFMKTAAIGDTVLLSALVRDLKARFPDSYLTFFAGSSNYGMAGLLEGVDHVVKLPVTKPLKSIQKIRREGVFDVWIDFGQWPRLDAVFSFFAKAKLKIGFKTKGQFRHFVFDVSVEHSEALHELDNFGNLLQPIGVAPHSAPNIRVDSFSGSAPYVVIHMFPGGAGAPLKEWPQEYWTDLIGRVVNAGYRVFLTGSKADRPRALEICNAQRNPGMAKAVAGELSLTRTAELVKGAAVVVSVNTGIMHLASALGCKLVALNGPTSAKRWGPLNKESIPLQSPRACSPCLNLGFEYGCEHNDCMRELKPEAVVEAIKRLLPGFLCK